MDSLISGEKAKKQLAEKGIDENLIRSQIAVLNGPPPSVSLDRPCSAGDGIMQLPAGRMRFYCGLYEKRKNCAATAFIPASGAASRMFLPLISADEKSLERFAENIENFAFFKDLKTVSEKRGGIQSLAASHRYADIADLILSPGGLGYGDIPKGLVKFHRYGDVSKTAFEDHVDFAGLYATGTDGVCRVHFTVDRRFYGRIKNSLSSSSASPGADVSFSFQNRRTDTVAVDLDGGLLTDESGGLVFRPAGHGALVENLGRLDEDVVFISNIDNVSRRAFDAAAFARKALAGLLLETRGRICALLMEFEKKTPDESAVSEAAELCFRFGFSPPETGGKSSREILSFFKNALDRPLRVCGVVKNTGEPGGAPFWAKDRFGRVSPQIVESIQVRRDCAAQINLWQSSEYFNPVVIACSMKNCAGEKFNLSDYGDNDFMVAEKKLENRRVRVLEMPGLWNGAMAGWNSLFAEIAPENFNPVKDVFDLLRDCHQDVEGE